jgi:hypothetical protein
VLSKKTPEAAGAGTAPGQVSVGQQSNRELKISFIELPRVVGRHDVINRDFFTSNNWRYFIERQRKRSGIEEVNMLSRDVNEEVIRKVAEKLKLEAVMVSENPQASINGNVVMVGSKMLIGDGIDKFECDVVAIKENTVVLKCKEAEIVLKLEQESMTDN